MDSVKGRCAANYRFVRYLIERAGIVVFLKLYEAKGPDAEVFRLYGANLRVLVAGAAK